jgi:O-antigen/teichoic acid export membrane protein
VTPAHSRPAHRARLRRFSAGADALLVPAALVATGLLAYAFLSLAARTLGPERYGPVALLWAATFLTAVVLFRAVEQTGSREIAARLERGEDIRPVARALARVVAALVALVVGMTAILWEPITNTMFEGRAAFTAAFVIGVALYGVFYLVRGLSAGIGWFGGYAGTLVADGVVRLVLAVPLLVSASADWAVIAIVAAPAGGIVWSLAGLRRRWQAVPPGREAPFGFSDAVRFGVPVAAIATADQVLVNGAPLLVAVGGVGDTRAAGVVFAATMLVRAPVFVFQGVGAVLLPKLAAVHAAGDRDGFRQAVARVAALLGLGMLVLVPVAYVAGRWAMGAFYGAGFAATGADLAILTAGVASYLVAATVAQGAIARGDTGTGGIAWGIAAATFVGLSLTLGGSPLHRVSVAFLVGSGVAAILSTLALARGSRRAGRIVHVPGPLVEASRHG